MIIWGRRSSTPLTFTIQNKNFSVAVLVCNYLLHVFAIGYHTPLDLYPNLYAIAEDKEIHTLAGDKVVNVCVGKEWYRYPSSFFLPDK